MPARHTKRHAFIISFNMPDGSVVEQKQFAKVRTPRSAIEVTLTGADVLKSIQVHGVGNTMTCSMAMCVNRLRSAFPHPVPPHGFIDWQYRTCYVVSKVDKRTKLPTECYRYLHNSKVAHINDTVGGQQELLKMVREAGGSITIRLSPRRRIDATKKGGTGRKTGSRSTVVGRSTGAHARKAFANLGLIPAQVR